MAFASQAKTQANKIENISCHQSSLLANKTAIQRRMLAVNGSPTIQKLPPSRIPKIEKQQTGVIVGRRGVREPRVNLVSTRRQHTNNMSKIHRVKKGQQGEKKKKIERGNNSVEDCQAIQTKMYDGTMQPKLLSPTIIGIGTIDRQPSPLFRATLPTHSPTVTVNSLTQRHSLKVGSPSDVKEKKPRRKEPQKMNDVEMKRIISTDEVVRIVAGQGKENRIVETQSGIRDLGYCNVLWAPGESVDIKKNPVEKNTVSNLGPSQIYYQSYSDHCNGAQTFRHSKTDAVERPGFSTERYQPRVIDSTTRIEETKRNDTKSKPNIEHGPIFNQSEIDRLWTDSTLQQVSCNSYEPCPSLWQRMNINQQGFETDGMNLHPRDVNPNIDKQNYFYPMQSIPQKINYYNHSETLAHVGHISTLYPAGDEVRVLRYRPDGKLNGVVRPTVWNHQRNDLDWNTVQKNEYIYPERLIDENVIHGSQNQSNGNVYQCWNQPIESNKMGISINEVQDGNIFNGIERRGMLYLKDVE